jgi:uncharacterized protein (TIGR02001 family)
MAPTFRRPPGGRTAAARLIVVAFLTGLSTPAAAQVAAAVSLDSDDRFRGVSLSDRRPAASLSLSYDDPSGFYAGGSASAADLRQQGLQAVYAAVFAGYAGRLGAGAAWEIGATGARVATDAYGRRVQSYTELYAGVSGQLLSARLYYSPHYFARGVATLYGEVNAAVRLSVPLRLFGHIGLLDPISGPDRRAYYDLRAGIAADLGRTELRAAWTRADPDAGYLYGEGRTGDALVVGASFYF